MWLKCVLVLSCFSKFAVGQFDTFVDADPDTLIDDDNVLLEKWRILETRIRDMSEEVFNRIYPILTDMMGSLNISRTCFRDSAKLLLGLRKLNTWAVKFLDASTKSVDGLLNVQMPSLGSYDECVENKVYSGRSKSGNAKVMFQGKYCSINVSPYFKRDDMASLMGTKSAGILENVYPEESVFSELVKLSVFAYSAPMKAGLCVPSGCSKEDINSILGRASDYIGMSVKAMRCEIKEEKKYTPVAIAIMTVYSVAGFLVFLGTAIDIYSHYSNTKLGNTKVQVLMSFSFISNFKKLTNTSSSSSTDCLNGIRFLSLSWVIIGHTAMLIISTNHNFPSNFEDYPQDIAFQVIINATNSVDTFFFLSGFLVCYTLMRLVKIQKKPFTVSLYIFHRVVRLLPAYAFVIGYEFIKPLTGSGPLFHETQIVFSKYCEKTWWSNLLFINNFYKQNEMCLPHTWFIAVDMQLYILALVILLPLMRRPKLGICIASLMIVGCMVITGVMSYMHNMMSILIISVGRKELDYYHHFHNMNPYLHAPPYCIGLLLGYYMSTGPRVKMSKVLQVIGWTISTVTCLAVVYGVRKWNNGVRPTVWENIIYSSFCRTAWASGVAWMTFCCCTGHGGVINYILSWKIWVPLSRLTYFAYLVHLTVLTSYSGNLRVILDLDYYICVWIFLGHICVTYAVAFAGSMLIEAPFLSLERVLLRRYDKGPTLSNSGKHEHGVNDLEKNGEIRINTVIKNNFVEKSDGDATYM